MKDADVFLAPGISIRAGELVVTACRSSGPGGQNVNKVSTRARLRFDLVRSPSLDDAAKAALASGLGSRLGRDGAVVVSSSRNRTFEANRRDCVEKLARLLRAALTPPKPRIATRPPRAAGEKRLQQKRARKRRKELRGKVAGEDLET
jgi:ribosome-associated protein